jgi:hypothetical protein
MLIPEKGGLGGGWPPGARGGGVRRESVCEEREEGGEYPAFLTNDRGGKRYHCYRSTNDQTQTPPVDAE